MNEKILILVNNLGIGGAERLVVDDVNELVKRGVDVKLVTLKREKDKSFSTECLLSKDGWTRLDFRNIYDFKNWYRLFIIFKNNKDRILVTHLWFSNTVGRICAKMTGIKTVISFEHNVYDNLKTRKMFFIDKILQTFSTKIIAVSRAVKNSLIRNGINEKKIEIVVNGIDLSKYKNFTDKKNNIFTFVFIGRLIYQKGVDILLEAFSKTENSLLKIVGDGDRRLEYENLSNKLKLTERVSFLGIRNDVPNVLSSSDCFVLPSRYEGLGIVVIEAMASGLPIIISDFEAGFDIIENEKDGLIVKKENPNDLFLAMNRIFNNPALAQNLSNAGLIKSKKFSVSSHVDNLLKIINEIKNV